MHIARTLTEIAYVPPYVVSNVRAPPGFRGLFGFFEFRTLVDAGGAPETVAKALVLLGWGRTSIPYSTHNVIPIRERYIWIDR